MSQNMMSVTSLNTKIKSLLEATFMHTLVEGEVASVTYHSSGHLYFSIKDDKSAIKCVMWRSSVAKMKFRIEKGMHIVVDGSVSVYTPRGEYQFQCVRIEPYGQGALALAYEQLKEKLKNKGYFDTHRKKVIPKYIKKIALVTAKESAALYDMLKIIEKRWALLEVTIVDTLVQGEQAASQIVRSLRYADSLDCDVIVVGRGGGSAEDLWCFNEEIVADALFAMHTPVVSAVGHEVDVLISDHVADLRAPTPSAAIEMILPDAQELLYTLDEMQNRLKYVIEHKLQHYIRDCKHVEDNLFHISPLRLLNESKVEFVRLQSEFGRVMEYKLKHFSTALPEVQRSYTQSLSYLFKKKEEQLSFLKQKFTLSDPRSQYKKGWAQVSYEGNIVDLGDLQVNDKFVISDTVTQLEAKCVGKHQL